MINYYKMSTIFLFIILPIFTLMVFVKHSSQDVNQKPIIDSKTGRDLSLLTHTYYAVQNQKTKRFLIWFGINGTVDSELDLAQGKFWHIFENVNQSWYKMNHHFGSHLVKISKSHEEGYYHIYNKDCVNGEHPNADADERGTIMCHIPEKGEMFEFNWKFIKKPEQTSIENHTKHGGFLAKVLIPVISISVIICVFVYLFKRRELMLGSPPEQAVFTYNNPGFINDSVYPNHRYDNKNVY